MGRRFIIMFNVRVCLLQNTEQAAVIGSGKPRLHCNGLLVHMYLH